MRVGSASAVLGAVVLLTGGCATSTATAPAAVPTTAGPPVLASPAQVVTVVTPKPRSAAPAVANTGTAWPAILASLAAYGQWSLANPDPAAVPTVAVPGCGTANQLTEQMTGLLGSQTVVRPSPVVFGTVTGPVTVAAGVTEAVLTVTASRPAEPVVSRTGKPVTTFAALAPTALEITLNLGSDQRWRFCSIESITNGSAEDPAVALL